MKSKYLKKVCSVVLAAALMLGGAGQGSMVQVEAADRAIQVVTDKESVKRGDTFTATVQLSGDYTGDYSVSGGQATLKYNPEQLELVGKAKRGSVLSSSEVAMKDVNDSNAGEILAIFVYEMDSVADLTAGADLFTAEFKVKDSAKGKIALTFEDVKMNHTAENYDLISVDTKSRNKELALNIPVDRITLNKKELTLNKGADETLTVSFTPADAEGNSVTWTTSDAKVASVDKSGKVTAVGKGTAEITAAAGDKSAVCKVTVQNPATAISVPKTLSLKKGQQETLKVTAVPADGDLGAVTWTSDNKSVAEVSGNGLVTAKADGKATITVTAGKLTASCVVTVKEIRLESISLDKKSMTIAKGKNQKLNVVYNPADTTDDKGVKWTVSDSEVLSVDGDGNVTGKKAGKAKVTAKVGKCTAECEVTVNVPLEKITFAKTELELTKGQSSEALKKVTYSPADTTDARDLTWATDNASVAAVDENGTVTAKKAGVAAITATGANNTKAVCKVTVREIPIDGVVLNRTDAVVEKGSAIQLTASVYPENTTDENKTIIWRSSDEKVAVVDENGLVTAVNGGKAVITAASSNGKKAECQIVVPIHMTGVTISKPQTTEVLKGNTISLKADPVPGNTTDSYTVEWITSDATVAAVDQDGMVTALKEGKAVITARATMKNIVFEDTVEITVKEIHMTGIDLSYNEENLSDGKLLKGQSLKIDVSFLPADTTDDKTVTWTTSDETIAAIDPNGIVTGLREGKVTVTAKAGAFEKTVELEIKEIALESIAFDKVISTMTEGEKAVLNVIYNPENTTDLRDVTWTTSDETVIAVVNGELTAGKAGKAVITAKVGEISVSCEITVSPKEETDGADKDDNADKDNTDNKNNNNTGSTNNNKNDKNNKKDKSESNGVKTGDTASAVPGVLAVASLFVIAVTLMRRRVRK